MKEKREELCKRNSAKSWATVRKTQGTERTREGRIELECCLIIKRKNVRLKRG